MILASIVVIVLLVALAIMAQYYRVLCEKAIEYALYQEEWIDDIISTLKAEEDPTDLIAEKGAHKSPLA